MKTVEFIKYGDDEVFNLGHIDNIRRVAGEIYIKFNSGLERIIGFPTEALCITAFNELKQSMEQAGEL